MVQCEKSQWPLQTLHIDCPGGLLYLNKDTIQIGLVSSKIREEDEKVCNEDTLVDIYSNLTTAGYNESSMPSNCMEYIDRDEFTRVVNENCTETVEVESGSGINFLYE